jgi:hypothetical protein
VFADLYAYLAILHGGNGEFYQEQMESDRPHVISADNSYDVSTQFAENNQ